MEKSHQDILESRVTNTIHKFKKFYIEKDKCFPAPRPTVYVKVSEHDSKPLSFWHKLVVSTIHPHKSYDIAIHMSRNIMIEEF